jgi:iron complex outermembrane receptor protein
MRQISLCLAASCMFWALASVGTAVADDVFRRFDIPGEDLGAALRDFGRQSNQQILFSTDIVAGKKTAGLKGSFTVEVAIAALLSGTDLIARRTADGSLLIARRDHEGQSGASETTSVPKSQDTSLEEVIVTATRRAISVQQVEGGIVPISKGLIRDTGAQTLADVAASAPGLSFGEMSPTEQVFTIRGVNTASQVGDLQSPTALYIDEVPVSDPYLSELTPSFQMFDVDRVEVLLGPQGTLFGAGALGGAVRVITNKPSLDQFGVDLEQTFAFPAVGNPRYTTNGMVNLPLISDTLALRLVGSYSDTGGYIDNPAVGQTNYNYVHTAASRAELMLKASPQLTITGTYSYESDRPNASPYTPYGSHEYLYYAPVASHSSEILNIANLLVEYAADEFSLTSSTSYLHRDPDQVSDATNLTAEITGLTAPATDVIFGHTRNLIQEFRIASPTHQDFRWLGGVYLQKYDLDEMETLSQAGAGEIFAGAGFPSDTILNDIYTGYVNEQAIYGELSYDFSPQFSATVGARAFHDTVAITDFGDAYLDGGPNTVHNSASYTSASPKFVASYKPADDFMYYIQVSKGFRSGQGNLTNGSDPLTGTPIPRFYGPDSLWNYEMGAKTSALDGRLTLNGDVYDIQWSKIQLQELSPSGFNYTANAGQAWIRGFDLQVHSQLTHALEAALSLDYHQSRLTEVASNAVAVRGDELPGSSRLSSYVYGKYNFPITASAQGFFRVDYAYSSKAFSNLDNSTSLHYGNVGSYGAQLGTHVKKYEFLLFGRNLANAHNRVNAFEFLGIPTQVLQEPRTIGLTLRWNY